MSTIRSKDRDAVLKSLRAGVVPQAGQHLIQVGRAREIQALINDLDQVAAGGASFRLVVGEYGAGKTFFLNLVRTIALEKRFVTMHADLSPDRRLQATGGQARSLFAELTRNIATRSRPEGGAMASIVEKFVSQAMADSASQGRSTEEFIHERLASLSELVNGFDFADVIAGYCEAAAAGDDAKKSDVIRWLRGEFSTKTDARVSLGVRSIIDDGAVYDQLKLMARFVRLAGYSGLVVCLDEMVNIYKLANSQARSGNYEQILRILNDTLQGRAEGLSVILGGTPEFLYDSRRGLYSYPALQSRLAENTFARDGLVDLSGPVVRLTSLGAEDYFILLEKIRHVYAMGEPSMYLLPDDALTAFMRHCSERLGSEYFRTPRTTITSFVNLLAVLEQNPGTSWQSLIGTVEVSPDNGGISDLQVEDDQDLVSFRI